MHISVFSLQMWGCFTKPWWLCKAPIEKGLCKTTRGFVHTYINTYTYFSLCFYRYGGTSQSPYWEGLCKSSIERTFTKFLHMEDFLKLPIKRWLWKPPLYRGFTKPLGVSKILYREGPFQSLYGEGALQSPIQRGFCIASLIFTKGLCKAIRGFAMGCLQWDFTSQLFFLFCYRGWVRGTIFKEMPFARNWMKYPDMHKKSHFHHLSMWVGLSTKKLFFPLFFAGNCMTYLDLPRKIIYGIPLPWGGVGLVSGSQFPKKCLLLGIKWNVQYVNYVCLKMFL